MYAKCPRWSASDNICIFQRNSRTVKPDISLFAKRLCTFIEPKNLWFVTGFFKFAHQNCGQIQRFEYRWTILGQSCQYFCREMELKPTYTMICIWLTGWLIDSFFIQVFCTHQASQSTKPFKTLTFCKLYMCKYSVDYTQNTKYYINIDIHISVHP